MEPQRERGLTYDAELLLKQSHTVQYRDWQQKYRRIRFIVYDFLDHPSSNFTIGSVLYHISAFITVLTAVVLGASADKLESQWMLTIYSVLETSLAIFFLVEFLIRMWAISADAKYMGLKGHMRYLLKPVCFADVVIIIATFVILLLDKRYVSDKTMDYLRFVQVLRLLHIDRQMTTFRLIKNMVQISKRELMTAYYITFVLYVLMATLVYHFESIPHSRAEEHESPVPTLAHAWWFSVVTITTIGYGDIVPVYWMSKVVVCILGFMAYCTFVTASTQISVGLTLMMEEDNKNDFKKQLNHAAAALIQNWWRYHVASRLKQVTNNRYRTTYFKDCCYKLYLTAETITKMRGIEKKVKERREKKRRNQKLIQSEWKSPLRLGATQLALQPTGLPVNVRRLSVPHLSRHMSLPVQDLTSAGIRPRAMVHQSSVVVQEDMSKFYNVKRPSIDTTVSSSFECSDSEHSSPLHEQNIINNDVSAVDEKLLIKYQPLLRLIYFLLFHNLKIKFKRLKKADDLLEMEAQLVDQIHERDQEFNKLESDITSVTGKAAVSQVSPQGGKRTIFERVELCEQKVTEIGRRADELNDLANMIASLLENPQMAATPFPSLPPAPPGRHHGRRLLRRQSKTLVVEEDDNENE